MSNTQLAKTVAKETTTIEFAGNQLVMVQHEGKPYVAMKPIAEGIGLDWSAQRLKLRQYSRKFNCGDITTVASDGTMRMMICIPLKKLNGWLFSINSLKCKASIRPTIVKYQEECFQVLYNHFIKKTTLTVAAYKPPMTERLKNCNPQLMFPCTDRRSERIEYYPPMSFEISVQANVPFETAVDCTKTRKEEVFRQKVRNIDLHRFIELLNNNVRSASSPGYLKIT